MFFGWFLFLAFGSVWSACPFQWFQFHSSCYFFGNVSSGMNFTAAQHYCQQLQSHLVEVDSKPENVYLKNALYQRREITNYWMDLTDAKAEGVWIWASSNTTAIFQNWHPGAPDSHYGNEDCAIFANYATYRWSDVPCSSTYKPLCEKK